MTDHRTLLNREICCSSFFPPPPSFFLSENFFFSSRLLFINERMSDGEGETETSIGVSFYGEESSNQVTTCKIDPQVDASRLNGPVRLWTVGDGCWRGFKSRPCLQVRASTMAHLLKIIAIKWLNRTLRLVMAQVRFSALFIGKSLNNGPWTRKYCT